MFSGNNREGNSCGVYMMGTVVEGNGTPAKDGYATLKTVDQIAKSWYFGVDLAEFH